MLISEKFADFFHNHFKILPKKILIAVSGGADSMALCYLAQEFAVAKAIELFTLTIDHQAREESSLEAAQLNKILTKENIRHEVIKWEATNIKQNFEARAREARYDILSNYAKNNNIKVIMTAHHQDDIIENFFIRLARGSGIDGLAGIAVSRNLNDNLKLWRPLLKISKRDLINYLKENNKIWFEDPTNKDATYLRNNIRNLLTKIEDKELIEKRIIQSAEHFSRAKDFFKQHTDKIFNEICQINSEEIKISLSDFCNLHPEIAYRILIKIFNILADKKYKPRFVKLDDLYKKIINKEITKINFAHSFITLKSTTIIFSKEPKSH
jgi:tRNA(Ile)-lysidine synthase